MIKFILHKMFVLKACGLSFSQRLLDGQKDVWLQNSVRSEPAPHPWKHAQERFRLISSWAAWEWVEMPSKKKEKTLKRLIPKMTSNFTKFTIPLLRLNRNPHLIHKKETVFSLFTVRFSAARKLNRKLYKFFSKHEPEGLMLNIFCSAQKDVVV